ncbi:MAG: outer membrane protein assembly factor BamD [Clostridia bacterium]|nr:outer membrane protein assembly factor BamD [Clostridia bacterium]
MFKNNLFILLLLASVVMASCSKHQKILKSTDNEAKYEKAMEYYDKGDYYRALQVFEQLMPVYRGTAKAEKLYYYYANAYYQEREYVLASYYFKRFALNFPTSEWAEEASFLAAYTKYLDSPRYSLDQTVTREAIDEFQLFINRYPFGNKAKEANELIDELRDKLQMKSYSIANLYYKMEDYRAAIVSYEGMLKDFPDTEYKEEILYRIIRSYYQYAFKSIDEKKKERYESAVKAYFDFVSLYPESEYMDEVQRMRQRVKDELQNFEVEPS